MSSKKRTERTEIQSLPEPEAPSQGVPSQEPPYIHLDWDEARGGLVATSNVNNFEWILLKYAKALKESV